MRRFVSCIRGTANVQSARVPFGRGWGKGRFPGTVVPNSPNAVPGQVTLIVDLRDLSADLLKVMAEEIRQRAAEVAQETGTPVEMLTAPRGCSERFCVPTPSIR